VVADRPSFLFAYGQTLRDRLAEGRRALFLFKQEKEMIGLANVYFSDSGPPTLHIAEFYIVPSARRLRHASAFLRLLEDWGHKRGANLLRAEVDKDQIVANRFWSAMGMAIDQGGPGNVYTVAL